MIDASSWVATTASEASTSLGIGLAKVQASGWVPSSGGGALSILLCCFEGWCRFPCSILHISPRDTDEFVAGGAGEFRVMGSSEKDHSAKDPKTQLPAKTLSSATSTGNMNPEWSGFQAYSPIPPRVFTASSPQAHPYMWGVQHIMPPYGTPHPYMAMYPHGVYAHPSIPLGSYPFSPFAIPSTNGVTEASGNTTGSIDADGKLPEGKEKLPIKRSKGSLGSLDMITGKNTELDKPMGHPANGVCSKRTAIADAGIICSAESASEGSSEGSDANSQNDSQIKPGSIRESLEADVSQNGSSVHGPWNSIPNASHTMVSPAMSIMPMSMPGPPGTVTTNLNIGMDYWGTSALSTIPAFHGKTPAAPVATGVATAGSRDNMQSQLWLTDERELKRQRRKQSNRESARRSRLRKQAECDELAQRAESLKEENASLRSQVGHIRGEYEQLFAENAALKGRLDKIPEDLETGIRETALGNNYNSTGQIGEAPSGTPRVVVPADGHLGNLL
ncbi:hypothetical protein Nepgr_030637 [Nepenthes gracilis]|uniref:BZIP domain-containing protein n=1 Tax=Nepenthes gracilis TaxID=150966 RepID=A0AAD3TGJ0_NEPGR|nr:hypothetical protein Nepgr_030637 [Nepenthes gracilis]